MRSSYKKWVKLALMKAEPLVKKQPLNILHTHGTKGSEIIVLVCEFTSSDLVQAV